MNTGKMDSNARSQGLDATEQEFARLKEVFKSAYEPVQIDDEYRRALGRRLMDQARFQAASRPIAEPSFMRRAIVGAAAVSAAGLAYMFFKHRTATLNSMSGSQ